MLRVIKIASAVVIVVAVVAVLIHPYIDGPNSVARKYRSHTVIFVQLSLVPVNTFGLDCKRLATSASPVQNADWDLLAQGCIRLC